MSAGTDFKSALSGSMIGYLTLKTSHGENIKTKNFLKK
ncbi:hypothetical protein SAMN05444146_4355 [Flavobacterium johnsoniae]|nr:hypothetical protein SAMN05444146_4355 [Flavobacterium johnsoniae]